jgi:hypothetical protein
MPSLSLTPTTRSQLSVAPAAGYRKWGATQAARRPVSLSVQVLAKGAKRVRDRLLGTTTKRSNRVSLCAPV